jgi:hypothetical protein
MRLRVENLGPIREAVVDLDAPFTVFTGPNNTGKTWLASAIYAAMMPQRWGLTHDPGFDAWCRELLDGVTRERGVALLDEVRAHALHLLRRNLPRLLLTQDRDDLVVTLEDAPVGDLVAELSTSGLRSNWDLETARGVKLTLKRPLPTQLSIVRQALVWAALGPATRLSHFLPAERAAITLFARELSAHRSALVDDALDAADPAALLRERAVRYPLVVRNALDNANQLDGWRHSVSPLADLAAQLERDVVGGVIRLDEQGELHFGAGGFEVPIHASASVVKSLASLVFYLRHQAQPGQLLIIDEPELNLHPDNHRRVARVLAKAVNRGLRVIISTHSDYIVRELSNLVVLGAAGERADAVVRELGHDREWLLRPEQINVLLFRGGGVERVPVSDAGFEVQTIEDEIRRLDVETQRILLGVE